MDCKGCHQRVLINVKKEREGITATTTPSFITPRVDSVTINFSCDTRINTWVPNQDRVVEQQMPLIFNSVRVDRPQIIYSDTTHNVVKEEIKGWNMSNYEQESMIKKVLSKVRDEVKTVTTGYNSLDVLVEVIVVHDHTLQERVCYQVFVDDLSKMKKKDYVKRVCRLARDFCTSTGRVFPSKDRSICS